MYEYWRIPVLPDLTRLSQKAIQSLEAFYESVQSLLGPFWTQGGQLFRPVPNRTLNICCLVTFVSLLKRWLSASLSGNVVLLLSFEVLLLLEDVPFHFRRELNFSGLRIDLSHAALSKNAETWWECRNRFSTLSIHVDCLLELESRTHPIRRI